MNKEYFGYIYKITNLINNKFYIGKHAGNIVDENYWGSGKLIKQAINKYDKTNFSREILEWCDSEEDLNKAEIYWIYFLDANNLNIAYNLAKGGEGNFIMPPFTEEHKLNIKKALKNFHKNNPNFYKGENNPNYGKKASIETRTKLSIAFKNSEGVKKSSRFGGHKHSEESKQKISDSCKQNIWITNGKEERMYNKNLTLPKGWHKGRLTKLERLQNKNVIK